MAAHRYEEVAMDSSINATRHNHSMLVRFSARLLTAQLTFSELPLSVDKPLVPYLKASGVPTEYIYIFTIVQDIRLSTDEDTLSEKKERITYMQIENLLHTPSYSNTTF